MDTQTSSSVARVPVARRSVLIVDDHPIVRQGLRRLIEIEPDLTVCGDVATESQARQAIRDLNPDVVIVDLALQEGDGLELVRDVSAHHPELPMLVLSMHDEAIYAQRLLAEGAAGYIMKQAASDQLLTALRTVLRGQRYVSEQLAASLRRRMTGASDDTAAPADGTPSDPVERLSNRELQVLNLVGRGVSSRDIAADLGLSVKTVESHRQSLKRKLSLGTNSQLLQFAINWFNSAARRRARLV
jgi:DNA-binding NarL/FixJ family response regulator